ncbi:MAG: flagellar motor protein MotB, partial [Candidatus Marinimicrobia bacterium CG_4_9_14_3_um_filter_48_9]
AQLESEKKIRIEGNRIIVANSILFNSGSAMIGDDGKTILDQIWGVLAKYPEREILIEGHTDNVPIADKFQGKYKSNWELSLSRSMAVLYYATSKPTAIPNRLGVVGYGEQRPIADNATEEGKRQNRRVEIVVGNVLKSK